ncbi:Spermatogenesis-defective protein 39 [Chionoecetes opilio]|uniref:Spermatogenesis-defective protein 39 n=1 Tax=Chionoecetes opilio TaxID=41210 RepID=A0A8J4XM69_CHIOP|nr:Spermatogenesis-defective protein 39 [Chionoecetes opilio]
MGKHRCWVRCRGLRGALSTLTSALGGSGNILHKGVKATLPMDQVVHTLQASGSPANVLAVYLGLMDNMESRLKLAVNYKCHQAVIDVHVAQKDRSSLEQYMKEIPPGSPEYLKAENALRVSTGWADEVSEIREKKCVEIEIDKRLY